MLHKQVYTDSFILHDEAVKDPAEQEELQQKLAEGGQDISDESVRLLSSVIGCLLFSLIFILVGWLSIGHCWALQGK